MTSIAHVRSLTLEPGAGLGGLQFSQVRCPHTMLVDVNWCNSPAHHNHSRRASCAHHAVRGTANTPLEAWLFLVKAASMLPTASVSTFSIGTGRAQPPIGAHLQLARKQVPLWLPRAHRGSALCCRVLCRSMPRLFLGSP